MSLWSSSSITNVNVGTAANDGSGDDIRDAFIKVDTNFGNISQWLAAGVQFQSANIDGTLTTQWANVTNANVITLYGGNTAGGQANVNIGAHLIPTGYGSFDLGSPSNPFRTVWSLRTEAATQIQSSSDAGLLKVHANANPGDIQDTGILGNISSDYNSGKAYVFFGHQYTTNDFAYKIIGYDPAAIGGNNIVDGGTYGNVHFGSAFLSNTTPSGNTLIVAGDTSITGNLTASANLNIGGAAFADGGYRVITTNIIGNYGNPYTGGVIAGNTVFLSSAVATNANTGAVSLPYGGLGVYGNVYTQTGMVAPSFYGQMRTADQPYITSLGTLPTLNAISGSFTSLSSTGLTTTGIVNLAGPTLTVASNTSIASFANIASGLIVGANAWIAGNLTAINNTYLNSNLTVGVSTTIGNALTVGTSTTLTNTFSGINSNAAVTVDSFSATTYGSAKYLVQLVDTGVTPNKVQTAELSLTHDRNASSTLVYTNTYGVVSNQGNVGLGVFNGSYVSGAIQLRFTPNYTPSALAIKVLRTALTL